MWSVVKIHNGMLTVGINSSMGFCLMWSVVKIHNGMLTVGINSSIGFLFNVVGGEDTQWNVNCRY